MTRKLESGELWIEGPMSPPPAGDPGPLVFGPGWLLEMVRGESTTTGFFWAPFAIIAALPELKGLTNGRFVGYAAPRKPPAAWLTTSMMFDLAGAPLAATPEELLALVQEPRPFVRLERSGSPLAEKAKRHIASKYREEMSIADVAAALGVSHAHLSRQFKRDFGLTPVNYRHRLRVSEAMGRLSQGEDILDIGFEVGFNDTTRFYDDFRKVTGTSPGKCRR